MRRSFLLLAALGAAAVLVAGFASSAGAYGGGASHDTWQIGLSFNCNNPSYFMCQDPETGQPQLGGFWGWVEFDRFADGTITGDAQVAGCGAYDRWRRTRFRWCGSRGRGHHERSPRTSTAGRSDFRDTRGAGVLHRQCERSQLCRRLGLPGRPWALLAPRGAGLLGEHPGCLPARDVTAVSLLLSLGFVRRPGSVSPPTSVMAGSSGGPRAKNVISQTSAAATATMNSH